MSYKKPRMEVTQESKGSNSEDTASDKIKIEKLLTERVKIPYANTVEEFLDNPMGLALRPQDLVKYIDDETLLTHTVKLQKYHAAAALLHMGADPNTPNKKGVTPISAAAHKGSIQIMKILIQFGASVNALNTSGSTALIQASHFGHLEAVRLLLENHASADFYNLKGTTALMRASQEGHVDISKLLIAAGADVNRKNYEGMNALMLASQRGHSAMVMLLIKAPCAMDEQTQQGSTALMLACKRGHEECVKVLVSMGAEIYVRDNRSRTARDTATRRNHTNLLPWLDTQAQIRLHQEYQLNERKQCLNEIKQAYEDGKLRIDFEERNSIYLLSAFHRREMQQKKFNMNLDNNNNNNNNNNRHNNFINESVLVNCSNVLNSSYNTQKTLISIPGSISSNLVRNNSCKHNNITHTSNKDLVSSIMPLHQETQPQKHDNSWMTFHKDNQEFFDHFIQQFVPQLPMPNSSNYQYNSNNHHSAISTIGCSSNIGLTSSTSSSSSSLVTVRQQVPSHPLPPNPYYQQNVAHTHTHAHTHNVNQVPPPPPPLPPLMNILATTHNLSNHNIHSSMNNLTPASTISSPSHIQQFQQTTPSHMNSLTGFLTSNLPLSTTVSQSHSHGSAVNYHTKPESNMNNAVKMVTNANSLATANWDFPPSLIENNEEFRDHIFVTSVLKKSPMIRCQSYEWSAILVKALTLPPGIFDLICDYLPIPRVWNWTLEVLKKRCGLIPQACAVDLSIMLDEMLTDADIFKGSSQKLLVMKLNANPHIYNYLVNEWKMSPPLINHLRVWADVQSILNRALLEYEFSLKLPMIRSMYGVCVDMLRWTQHRYSPYRVLVETVGSSAGANELLLKLNPAAKGKKSMYLGHFDDPTGYAHLYGNGGLSGTGSSGGDNDLDSVIGTETLMDQDTETELQNDLDADDTQDEDSDNEGGGPVPPPTNAVFF